MIMKQLLLAFIAVTVISVKAMAVPVAVKFKLSGYTYELTNERQSYKNHNGSAIIQLISEGDKPCTISMHFTSIWSFDLQDVIETNNGGRGLKPLFLGEESTEGWYVNNINVYLPETKIDMFLDILRNHKNITVLASWEQDSKSSGSVANVEHVKVNLSTETTY